MKRSTGQAVVLISSGALIVASAMAWVNWVWVPGILELSHRGISLSIASVPTYMTLVAAAVIFGAAFLALRRIMAPTNELGVGVLEVLLAAGAATPAVFVLSRLSDATHFAPPADAGFGLWLTFAAAAGAAIGGVMVILGALRDRRLEKEELLRKEEEIPQIHVKTAA